MSVEVIKCEVPINIKLIHKTKKKNRNPSNAFFSSKSLESDYLKFLERSKLIKWEES